MPTFDDSAPTSVTAVILAPSMADQAPGHLLRTVGGIPIIARAVASALCTELVDQVLVVTDDRTIEAVADSEGADTVMWAFGPSRDARAIDAIALAALRRVGASPEIVVLQCASAPFVRASCIDDAIRRVRGGDCASAVSPVFQVLGMLQYLAAGSRSSGAVSPHPVDALSCIDVRTEADLALARRLADAAVSRLTLSSWNSPAPSL